MDTTPSAGDTLPIGNPPLIVRPPDAQWELAKLSTVAYANQAGFAAAPPKFPSMSKRIPSTVAEGGIDTGNER